MLLTFLGATETVTGSKYLVEVDGRRILIDCGLFQGYKELRLRNWSPLPLKASDIDAVLLTHAHIDHSGYVPLLVKQGYRKRIYASYGTHELCKLLLPDSGYLQEEDARRANQYGYSKHRPALPLYTEQDARNALTHFHDVTFYQNCELFKDVQFTLHPAGHILGASTILLHAKNKLIAFSGDVGRPNDPIMPPPDPLPDVDYLVVESTYGNRSHDKKEAMQQLELIINRTTARGGSILIPAFAVGRTQHLLYYLFHLKKEKRIPLNMPIYLDSPMAIDVTSILSSFAHEHRLSQEESKQVCAIAEYTRDVEASKMIDRQAMPKIVISASGMMTGGRVLHHLKHYAPDHRNTILFTGFQAGGTRGDRLLRGEKEVKVHGEMVQVQAEIHTLSNMSAHADANEMVEWLGQMKKPPTKTFITHGEKEAAHAFKEKIEKELGWSCVVPHYQQVEKL